MLQISEPSSEIFKSYGFEESVETKMFKQLQNLTPEGGTALRDSIIKGLQIILKIHEELEESSCTGEYNIIHIVITDGNDENSSISERDMYSVLQGWNQNFGNSVCQTVLVGISLNENTKTDLDSISYFGGESFRSFNVGNDNISEIFQRISLEFGIMNQTAIAINQQNIFMVNQSSPYMVMKRKKVALLFNLDFSSSMKGFRWNSLIMNAFNFVKHLTPGDLLTCILFNHEVNILNEVYKEHKAIENLGSLFQLIAASAFLMQPNESSSESIILESESEDQINTIQYAKPQIPYANPPIQYANPPVQQIYNPQIKALPYIPANNYAPQAPNNSNPPYQSGNNYINNSNNYVPQAANPAYQAYPANYNNYPQPAQPIYNPQPAQPIYNPPPQAIGYAPNNNLSNQGSNYANPSYPAQTCYINYSNNPAPKVTSHQNSSNSVQNKNINNEEKNKTQNKKSSNNSSSNMEAVKSNKNSSNSQNKKNESSCRCCSVF